MADDLKTMLGKVLKSKGSKRFSFAYGTGKRKDGKGDGALAVAAKKIKKEKIEEECECAQFYDGFCWSSADGETIYLGGKKKLGGARLAKVALSVKKVTGRQYEFAIPTPEQETAADQLGEEAESGESEGEEGETQPTDGQAGQAAKALSGWQAARQTVITDLRKLSAAIVEAKDPEANEALVVLGAIIKNLTASPTKPQQVQELERYLQTDEIIDEAELPNPFGLTIAIKTPLLNALQPLKEALGA